MLTFPFVARNGALEKETGMPLVGNADMYRQSLVSLGEIVLLHVSENDCVRLQSDPTVLTVVGRNCK